MEENTKTSLEIREEENLSFLLKEPDKKYDLIYIDPPYNTGKMQKRGNLKYSDKFDDFIEFLVPRLKEAYRVLKEDGCMFVHLDWREVHYIKIEMDKIFGRDNFLNEIIWSYDYGARQKTKWATKHDNILLYVKDKDSYCFNSEESDRIPYMAPGLVGEEKAANGKIPTDVWWNTIVPTNGKEKTGYPTQKPLGIIDRIVKVHSDEGDLLLDFLLALGRLGFRPKRISVLAF